MLLARRFLEAERDAQRAPYAANFDCGAPVALAGVPADGTCTLTFEAAGAKPEEKPSVVTLSPAERSGLRAPGRAGFFVVRRGDEVLVRGSAQFADARQGDFRAAEKFVVEVRSERAAAIERNTVPDPFVVVWLALVAAAVLWSWWTRGSRNSEASPLENVSQQRDAAATAA